MLVAIVSLGFVALIMLTVAAIHDVRTALDPNDVPLLVQMYPNLAADASAVQAGSFDAQVKFVRNAQLAVLRAAPKDSGLPYDQPRGPQELLSAGYGLCYDRSWNIERFLEYAEMEYRHVSLFWVMNGSKWDAVRTPGNPSHAITEVRTAHGWMIVDSNHPWLGLTKDSLPVSLDELRANGFAHYQWAPSNSVDISYIYQKPLTWVYGLYSRHGRFYPPYNFIPDYNFRQLAYNLN